MGGQHYDPNQPRDPKGSPTGGQWADTGSVPGDDYGIAESMKNQGLTGADRGLWGPEPSAVADQSSGMSTTGGDAGSARGSELARNRWQGELDMRHGGNWYSGDLAALHQAAEAGDVHAQQRMREIAALDPTTFKLDE